MVQYQVSLDLIKTVTEKVTAISLEQAVEKILEKYDGDGDPNVITELVSIIREDLM